MRQLSRAAAVLAFLLGVSGPAARADVKPHALFADGMVLQRGVLNKVWGTAEPGEAIEVSLSSAQANARAIPPAKTTADKDGKWVVEIAEKLTAGGPYVLHVKGKNALEIKDVLVGDVWVCSGQSNMEWSVNASAEPDKVKKESANPKVRLFRTTNAPAMTPQRDVQGKWEACGPDTIGNFSAVGYHFGRYLQAKLDVPIGLIQNAWGGTPAEVWTSRKVLEADPKLKYLAEQFDLRVSAYPKQLEAHQAALAEHKKAVEKAKADGKPEPKAPAAPPDPKTFPYNAPFLLYNSRVATLIPFGIKGAIWYQGESNAGSHQRAEEYVNLFASMIKNWRDDWGQGDFSFLFVQLAPFMKIEQQPMDPPWAWLREAQRITSLKVPHTAMAVITDVGDERDIHPKQKRPVGERLAMAALAIAYGQKVPYTGPVYDSMKVADGKAVLSFKNVEQGLEARGGELTGFTIAGKDGKFVNAKAVIQGDQVIVSSADVAEPTAVRFGWANYPVVNLWGKDGLPASPFRTDDLPAPGAAKPSTKPSKSAQ